jgi:hypothetical protein
MFLIFGTGNRLLNTPICRVVVCIELRELPFSFMAKWYPKLPPYHSTGPLPILANRVGKVEPIEHPGSIP